MGQWCDVAPKWAIIYLGAKVNFSSLEKGSEFIYFKGEKERTTQNMCKFSAQTPFCVFLVKITVLFKVLCIDLVSEH